MVLSWCNSRDSISSQTSLLTLTEACPLICLETLLANRGWFPRLLLSVGVSSSYMHEAALSALTHLEHAGSDLSHCTLRRRQSVQLKIFRLLFRSGPCPLSGETSRSCSCIGSCGKIILSNVALRISTAMEVQEAAKSHDRPINFTCRSWTCLGDLDYTSTLLVFSLFRV